MENPSYIALSQQMALRRQMDVIANNLANMSTPGYKAERVVFAEMLAGQAPYADAGAGNRLSFVSEFGMLRDIGPGTMMQTGNPLDIAIHGSGYFVVDTPSGPRYTRQGSFHLDQDGRIVNNDGHALLDESDRPIMVPPGSANIEISPKGSVATEGGEIARIRLVGFDNEQGLRKLGGGLYESDAAPVPVDEKTEIRQGMIEGSNVQGVTEMTNMIEVLRRYQSAQQIIDSGHDLERRAIEKLSHVS